MKIKIWKLLLRIHFYLIQAKTKIFKIFCQSQLQMKRKIKEITQINKVSKDK